jgi:rhamnose utilization protein RhaD (predicted bifunctional aldolase and dehydrogenase)/NAD(P)-dependent dehydrogenase (short-subunit alcohol dehydrogenase family)
MTMHSRWCEADARSAVARYAASGIGEDVALRTYSTRLLGSDPLLVLHGGGNTSVKTQAKDLFGRTQQVLCVKGSGWDMGSIEPAGLPAVLLEPLRALRGLAELADADMVSLQRANLIDAGSPNPSVETLLHAFLPHKFVDHTHSAAVLALVDQPNSEALVTETLGEEAGFVPYVIPGFRLAKLAADVFERRPGVKGLILDKHGIFTFGASAREAYEQMIAMVSRAEERLARGRRRVFAPAALPSAIALPEDVAPIVRGACAGRGAGTRELWPVVLSLRTSSEILNFVNGADLASYAQRGVVTPDHVIRTKNLPLLLPAPRAGELDAFRAAVDAAVAAYVARYDRFFARENARTGDGKTKLDPMPRVVLVPGIGLYGVGSSPAVASIAADLAENGVRVITDAEAIGRFAPLGEADAFDVEYWSLEQAKLKGSVRRRFTGQVVLVTGGGGGIGRATALAFAAEGASIVVLDRDPAAAERTAGEVGGMGIACDVTRRDELDAAFAAIVARYGGLDIAVSNAGAAWEGRIGEVEDALLRASFELNFFAHQAVAQGAVRIMRQQGTGGVLLFNISKQAVNPGPDFGPYGLPKAATLALMRQYAIDYGAEGIRANGVNADRVHTGLLSEDLLARRAAARGLSKDAYLRGNLLRREVAAADVAQAFVALASARATTGHVATVDGGNIAAALR